ncbi:hypothetical protein [Streptococcus agalactiae]|uniref:hypothetical protein n=1 Tax=Streptococcus agalactiae TaxID=1311 RepID=UPI0024158D2A|nr:hypothetical protein [Streptococcus agalactiae]
MILLKKNPRCLITDELFLEVEWQDDISPMNDPSLFELIETIDDHLLRESHQTIESTLPYLSFYQADLLFSALSQSYGYFTFKKVSLCHLDNKGKGASSEGELFASPYVVSANYTNLLEPFFIAITLDKQFSDFSYNEKREYFVVTVFPTYKRSLQLSESAMPVFPSESDLVKIAQESKRQQQVTSVKTSNNTRAAPRNHYQTSMRTWLILGLISILAIVSLLLSFSLAGRLNDINKKVTYLHQEEQILKDNQKIEHQIDVFSRYFLPNYYSGDKQKLANFLDDGDAKYTIPQKGNLQFVLLENISDKTSSGDYKVSYVLSVADEKGSAKQVRLRFNLKPDKNNRFGFVLTNEPKEESYIKTKN